MKKLIFLLFIVLFSAACSKYQKAVKSTDPDFKYEKAMEYYHEEEYNKAYTLLDELLTLYRGTEKAADVYYYFAYTNFYLQDFILAAYHFRNFNKTFPGNDKTTEAAYMVGYCYYLQSPRASLDQTYTYKAINELQLFINTHPTTDKIDDANVLIDTLQQKLETKSYQKAKLYYDLGQYEAAVTTFNNTLNDFPDTRFREEAHYYKLVAAYEFAKNSIMAKKRQRYIEARTASNEYQRLYPEGKFINKVSDYGKKIELALIAINKDTNNS